ncbi:NUDIX domain-containing protein [Paracoccus rhizosphaerae]|uniref:NUDIX domain-containing protein n=1 Tax=Paracoccus rhizosphaerae TaxID=1133347 RepID=A0ABV6CLJ5_9RHOB|nr:NUDIX domain-containing protein [Paracoccus rhizosphaerae]
MIVLTGPLAARAVLDALCLEGTAMTLNASLAGVGGGIDRNHWPVLTPAAGTTPGVAVVPNDALRRYAAVMGLQVYEFDSHHILGIAGIGPAEGAKWRQDPAKQDLAAEIARQIVQAPAELSVDHLAWRLPMIGIWASSRLRAARMEPSGKGVVPPPDADAVRVVERRTRFSGYFAVEEHRLSHALHEGGHSDPVTREAFLMGDAAVLLPWDPQRDRVLLVDQFRFAPAVRGDPQPWLLEPVAGRVDAGEAVEDALRREAREEAALDVGRMFPAASVYPSPGAVCEFIYHYVGIADLPDGSAGVHGAESEAEDIRGHLMPRRQLSDMVRDGQITNGPLVLLSLWLDAQADRLKAELAGG